MKDDYPDYDEWYIDFLVYLHIQGYVGLMDKEWVRGYYEADDTYPDEAAKVFIANLPACTTPRLKR